MLEVSIIKCLSDNYSYLIKDKKTNLVGVVDPSEFDPVEKEIKKNFKKLDFILNTHHHNDHMGGNIDLKKKYKAQKLFVLLHVKVKSWADIKKSDNDQFIFWKNNFKIIHIPGHTIGHICFLFKKANIIFTGDTLFSLGMWKSF